MGSCFSKKTESPSSNPKVAAATSVTPLTVVKPERQPPSSVVQVSDGKKVVREERVDADEKKNVHAEEDVQVTKKEVFVIKHRKSHDGGEKVDTPAVVSAAPPGLRASSCTKEEVDAILIQCGRLSRSNSSGKLHSSGSKKYSGSKRSYDFDNEGENREEEEDDKGDDGADLEETRRERHRHRGPRHHSSPAGASSGRRRTPSRERDQRSGSRERSSNRGRRISRSPARRVDSVSVGSNGNSSSTKPAKMMTVPPTVAAEPTAVNRITVKRNINAGEGTPGVTRGIASPRSMSPARINQQQPPLCRNSARKADHSPSPFRRNPLIKHNLQDHKLEKEVVNAARITRSRSARRSRELDFNPEALISSNPPSSYTALLLEDIQNFHQKTAPAAFPLPSCLSKACSILDAVADLNASTYSDERRSTVVANLVGKPASDINEPFLESEIQASDDLTEPSIQKYVTFRNRNPITVDDTDEQESSGSNSYVGGGSSNLKRWESSADSTERDLSRGFSSQRTVVGRARSAAV